MNKLLNGSDIIVRCYDRLPPLRQVGKLSYVGGRRPSQDLIYVYLGVRIPCTTDGMNK